MAGRKQSKGTCVYCGQVMAKGGASKHLAACAKRREAIEKTDAKKGSGETLYHLRAEPVWPSDFWLNLEARGSATLEDLDYYLRAIWLECCGHLSRFSIGGWGADEFSMNQSIHQVFKRKADVTHIYDFGTSSETIIKVAATREGKPLTARPIALMARNLMPEAECIVCQEAAFWLCEECMIEDEVWGTLCNKHAKTHPHDDYGEPVRLVNSPRLGMCGYEGPADPPY